MADKSLRFLLFGEDKTASKTFKKLETNAKEASTKTGGSFKHLGGVIGGALAGAGVASFLKDSVTGWQDHQKLLRQTAAVMKSTGGVAGMTTKSMGDLSDNIEANTGVDGDNVLAGENMLATFTNIHNQAGKGNDIFSQSTKIMTDMSVAMGTDMKGQAIQLGKALNDPIKGIGALSKVGVTFTDQQKKQIAVMVKAGDTAGAQRVILKELNHEFGGSAKAQESSTDKMMVAFHGLQDSVGQILSPILTALAGIMTRYVIPAFQAAIGFGQKHKTTIEILGFAIGAVVLALGAYKVAMVVSSVATKVAAVAQGAFTAGQWLFNAAMEANPIGLVVGAIVALGLAFVIVYKKSATFRRIVADAFDGVKSVASGMWSILKGIFHVWKLQFVIIGKAATFLWRNVVEPAAGGIKAAFHAAGAGLTWVWDNVIKPVFGFIKSGIRGVRDIIKSVGGAVSDAFKTIGSGLKWVWDHTIGPIYHKIMGAVQDIKDAKNVLTGNPNGITHQSGTLEGGITSHATGGTVPDGMFTAGEHGIELGYKHGNTVRFYSHAASGPMLGRVSRGGGGGDTYNITLGVMGDAKSAARVLLAELQRLKGSGTQLNLA